MTLTPGNLPSHSHTAQSELEAYDTTAPTNNYPGILNTPNNRVYKDNPTPTSMVSMSPSAIAPTGQSQPAAHENRQPFLTFNYCIAWEGVFSSRS